MRINSAGNVAIGASSFNGSNPEQFLVQAGTTTSFNLMQGHGKINNYLQINIQNDSAGTSASSDLVATSDNGNESSNFIDMGINSSANTSTGVIGGANNAYLYSTGNDFSLGNSTSGKSLLFFTGGTAAANERMRINGAGRVGIGVTDPANPLVIKDTLEIRRTGTASQLLFSNTAGFGDFRIGADGGDIFWQGGGGRNLQMGAYWGILLGGDRQINTFPSFSAGTGNTGVLIQAQRDASVPLGIQANSATQTANLTEWRTSAAAVLNVVDKNGNVGLGTGAPSTKLHVVGTNPLTLTGVQTGTNTSADSLLTITSGLVRKLPLSTFVTAGSFWATGGNTVTAEKKFGTIDNFDLPFITNNTEQMRINSAGNVAIGASSFNAGNPEQLLVQAGTTTSFNLMQGHGKINNYLQINIQNDSAGVSASSDVVATSDNGNESANFIDMGINSSVNTSTGVIGGANTAYLYSTGNDFSIGNSTSAKSLLFFTGGTAVGNERMRIDGTGHMGIGVTSPTARLHLPAGTATAGTAPLKLTSGTNLTTPEAGAVEFDGTNYFATSGSTRYTLAKTLTATASLNFGSTLPGASAVLTLTVTGAADGDVVALGVPNAAASIAGANYSAYVSAANTVTIKLYNSNGFTSINPGSITYRVSVLKY
jgi:3-methyladenine DNA glycosylase Mpg